MNRNLGQKGENDKMGWREKWIGDICNGPKKAGLNSNWTKDKLNGLVVVGQKEKKNK